ncbi:MAG TPA: helix-turn-helix domain-containing protein, partial [Rhodothermales bacterium]|nr:helix-turn-helix domain-containing protein [Rhodothermales bacterium]
MADSSKAASSKRFARDLSKLRKEQDVTLDSLHEATKVPLELLREFEETGLFDHPMFNRVYLRSLIRAYADTVGISPKEALSALDLALAGTYNGELIRADEEPVQEAEAETATPPVEEKAAKADEGKAPEKAPPPATEAEPDVREKSPQTPPPSGKPQ